MTKIDIEENNNLTCKNGNNNVINLEPFIHQVGGRSTILSFGQTVCKPIKPRELAFYESLPKELKPFTPEFRGLIEVEFNESSDGYLAISAKIPDYYKSETNGQKSKYRIKLCKSEGDIQIESNYISLPNTGSNHIFESGSNCSNNGLTKVSNNLMSKNHNPWVLNTFSSLIKTDNQQTRKFLLLENLTNKFKIPCIMDLKMGTRGYDDWASEAVKLKHILSAAKTTTGSMGIRITGIQVYNKSLDRFICHNKYYGKTLTPEGLVDAFKMFLQIDNPLKLNLISILIDRLEKLLSVVKKLDSFRFYTSSLLIVYEGNVDKFDSKFDTKLVDIRMIDFGHSTHQSMPLVTTADRGPDEGYILGLNNLIRILKNIQSESYQ